VPGLRTALRLQELQSILPPQLSCDVFNQLHTRLSAFADSPPQRLPLCPVGLWHLSFPLLKERNSLRTDTTDLKLEVAGARNGTSSECHNEFITHRAKPISTTSSESFFGLRRNRAKTPFNSGAFPKITSSAKSYEVLAVAAAASTQFMV
jgi:hypothetical protein